MERRKAFTLAEVLITLGIIGVVAAITMPTLIANYQKQQTVTQLKKAYNVISQALQMSTVDNGQFYEWDWSLSTNDFVKKYIIPYLKIAKDCGITETASECSIECKRLSGTEVNHSPDSYYVITADGMKFSFFIRNSSNYMSISVDINGNKRPNVSGKDEFDMRLDSASSQIDENMKLNFIGSGRTRETLINDTNFGCNKTATYGGHYCGALIQQDGWQIKDDYPW